MRSPLQILLIVVATTIAPPAFAQPPAAPDTPYSPKQSDRPQRIDGEEPGFRSIFNGRNLDGWAGNPTYWRVEDGAIVGEITPDTTLRSNTFIIWQGGQPADFELKLEYRITAAGNSGINYRSAVVPDPTTPANAFAMRGYQLDIDGRNRHSGNNYEEKGRLFLGMRGQLSRVTGGQPPIVLAEIGDNAALGGLITDGWNTVHLIARGKTLIHMINGQVMTVVIDDDAPNRPERGQIGVQVHTGPPMKVEYRNIRLKTN